MLTTDRATTYRYDDKCSNRFLKHNFLSNLNKNALRHKRTLIWRHAWRWFPKNSYTKQTTKVVLFSILRRNLSKFITHSVYIAVSS